MLQGGRKGATALNLPVGNTHPITAATLKKVLKMLADLRELPIAERIRLVEDLWDSIAADQASLPVTSEQMAELDRRLDTYESDGVKGRTAAEVIAAIRKKL
jgi:putative addiction module component (TIGR02574 family)